jgi:hypothetical protein
VHPKCTKKLQCRKNALMDKNLLLLKCTRVENKPNTAGKIYERNNLIFSAGKMHQEFHLNFAAKKMH